MCLLGRRFLRVACILASAAEEGVVCKAVTGHAILLTGD